MIGEAITWNIRFISTVYGISSTFTLFDDHNRHALCEFHVCHAPMDRAIRYIRALANEKGKKEASRGTSIIGIAACNPRLLEVTRVHTAC